LLKMSCIPIWEKLYRSMWSHNTVLGLILLCKYGLMHHPLLVGLCQFWHDCQKPGKGKF
jgi:hypothetical protein